MRVTPALTVRRKMIHAGHNPCVKFQVAGAAGERGLRAAAPRSRIRRLGSGHLGFRHAAHAFVAFVLRQHLRSNQDKQERSLQDDRMPKSQIAKSPHTMRAFWCLVHSTGFEPVTARFVAEYSIQLSYECKLCLLDQTTLVEAKLAAEATDS